MSEMNESDEKKGKWFNSESVNNITQTLALVGAGIWGIYTFIYQAQIVPTLAPPTLSVTSNLEKAGQKGDKDAILATITRSNVGQTSVKVLGYTFNVIGVKQGFLNENETNPAFLQNAQVSSSTVREARRYGSPEKAEPIMHFGRLFKGASDLSAELADLNPGESLSRVFIFYADRSKFDYITIRVRFVYMKLADPPIPLTLEVDKEGLLSAKLDPVCTNAPEKCRSINTTEFTTIFSLW